MKKRFLSLLCVLALCLGLLPVTALAAAPSGQVIYVGNVNVTNGGYWTTDNDGIVTAVTDENTPTDSYIHYDAENNILTLHNATIKVSVPLETSTSYLAGAAIGVLNEFGNAELTIKLEGTNTIANVNSGINMLAASESTTSSSSLTITGDGSLNASASQRGILVQSNSSDAALKIENAKVTATIVDSYGGNGVLVQSKEGSSASLTVNGGSLTATGKDANYAGIYLRFGSGVSGSGTPTVTVSGNAIVRANGGIGDNSTADITIGADSSSNNGGIVWNGTDGTVYGSVTLQDDLTISEGETLTIGQDASLTVPEGKTITVASGGKLEGTPTGEGTVKIAPTITTESLPNGTVGTSYSQTLAATGDATITWSLASGSTLPAGLTLDTSTGVISGAPTTAGASTFTVKAENSAGSGSKEYTIQIAAKSDTTPPMLTAGTVNRTSDKDATVTFTSDEAGTYFYKVVDSGAGEPTDITSGTSYTLTSDTNTITLTDLTAGAKDIYIVAKDASDNQSATLKMEIPACVEPVYSISANTTVLDFGSACPGYTQPAAKTVTITNTGNQPLTLTQPASTSSFEVGTLSKTALAAGETATFTVQPKAGLAEGTYSEDITVSSSQSATVTISASFAVKRNDNQDTSDDEPASTPTPVPAPTIVSGAEAVWRKGSGVGLTFTSDADFAGFQGVMVDGTTISAQYYTAKSGSTVVTLKASYLETLAAGEHTVAIVSDTGTAGARFTILSGTSIPQTGDNSNLAFWLGLLAAGGLALAGVALYRRKRG